MSGEHLIINSHSYLRQNSCNGSATNCWSYVHCKREAARTGEKFDEKEDAKMVAFAESQEEGSLALRATSAISDDGIIDQETLGQY